MDMEEQANAAATAAREGDLADVVARANSMPYSAGARRQAPPPPPPCAAGRVMTPCEEERQRRPANVACGGGEVTFEAPPSTLVVDPYLLAAAGGYGLPQQHQHQHQQLLAFQISEHACCAAADSDDPMRISPPPPPPPPAPRHQMITSYCGMACTHIPYCRKNDVRKVVCIPAPPVMSNRAGGGGEVIPSDLWAWRKYGQKPIKGSPYPRGYYRCSSSKGCLARKQVERSRSDPNMLVITYTAEHNHPWPMQRNVLAGYARAHTHTAAKKQQKISSSSSADNAASSSSSNSFHVEQINPICGDQLPVSCKMPDSTATAGDGGGLLFEGIQPDEVFAELEELETDNNPMTTSANVYGSRGVSSNYEWHKF
ncbi:probable WRKY transcription factor 14 isoform X1 [Triticum urartu]|uniref:probable WRKY transcription factor 14 isoform X1 n=1 Tax=Triticum urartu TaxID=4572 RepID=UPI002043E6BF|nr:probable WRKY transcription factor 14 isoform X1 [Triticum urartu]